MFFIHFFSLPCLKQEKQKLINFENKHGHYFKSTGEPQRERPAPWLPRRSLPWPPLGALEHHQSRRAGAEGSRDFTGQRSLPTLLFGRAPGGPYCHPPLPVGGARGASRFTLRNKQTLKGIGLHTCWWRNFPIYKQKPESGFRG